MATSKRRVELIATIESIIGSQCFNANTMNWGAGGVFEGDGREFRYPIVFTDDQGNSKKSWGGYSGAPANVIMTGRYQFGANTLYIMRALDKVLTHLEKQHALKI